MAGVDPTIQQAVRAFLAWEEECFGLDALRSVDRPRPSTPEQPIAPNHAREREAGRGRLQVIAAEAATCTRCRLHEGRTHAVFARGDERARVVFVGEGPGYHEDQQGTPFVGRAGQLLDKMIAAMKLRPEDYYICNVVKCRPPDNRTPLPDEANACIGYLEAQLEVVNPEVIVALGRCAAEYLGCLDENARGWRGRWTKRRGVDVMATYHPAFLLRNENMKRPVWEDLQQVMRKLSGQGR